MLPRSEHRKGDASHGRYVFGRTQSVPPKYGRGVSRETAKILEGMMKKSNLSALQKKTLRKTMLLGKTLPLEVSRAGSYKREQRRMTAKEYAQMPIKKYYARIRSKAEIDARERKTKVYYRPSGAGKNMQQEKERFARLMERNGKPEEAPPASRAAGAAPARPTVDDRAEELQREIEDRLEFLGEMDAIGKAGQYKNMIGFEIKQLEAELARLKT